MNKLKIILVSSTIFPAWLNAQPVVLPSQGPAAPAISLPDAGSLLDPALTSRRLMALSYLGANRGFQESLSAISAIPDAERNFENTVRAADLAKARFLDAAMPLSFLNQVSPDPRVRSMATAIESRKDKALIDFRAREDIFRAMEAVEAKGGGMDAQDRLLLDNYLRDFRRAGMSLSADKRARVMAIQKKLAELVQAFQLNINACKDELPVEPEKLAGLPEGDLARFKRTGDGMVRLTLDHPSYMSVMDNVKDPEVRRRLEFLFTSRPGVKNMDLLSSALSLRQELAELLGFKDFPEYAIAVKMAKTPGKVWSFLLDLVSRLSGPGGKDLASLLEAKREDDPSATHLEPWDIAYYAKKLQSRLFQFDEEEVRQYFPSQTVVEGTLQVYQEVLGLRFEPVLSGAWHPDVRVYEMFDSASGAKLGRFYLDLYPRQGKYTHAAAFNLVDARVLPDGSRRMPMAAMVTNFTQPAGDKPSLMTHDEAETFFHEFGHLMHHLLSRTRHAAHSSFNVAPDFVEVPSQALEGFVWTPEVLDRISGHWRDPSRKLPKELVSKMLAGRRHMAAYGALRQLSFGILDMMMHTLPASGTLDQVTRAAYALAGVPLPQEGTHRLAAFGHMMNGYEAGYYGYMWAKVIAEAVMDEFIKSGPLNKGTGMRLRKEILEAGAGRDEMESVRNFLGGREPGMEPFLRSIGALDIGPNG